MITSDNTQMHASRSELAREQAFRSFLDRHLDQEMLRFTTAGSVDDGKSTLIGRLLHDTRSVYEDQLASIRASRVNRSGGELDLSLLTDGLRAEREQGITIDVAYRYFSTAKRKFIIADTPGHEQYTRNMATGASTADVAIVLIDAKAFAKAGSLLPQTRRHTYIASLLRIPHVVAAVNKMDLVGYDERVFEQIRTEYLDLASKLQLGSVELIPVSALAGDNVVEPSTAMSWYSGPTLLEYLETVPLQIVPAAAEPLRFPVQLVVRPDAEFRGFAGRVERGELRVGQIVRALPSGRTTRVSSIVTYDGELKQARAGQSVTLTLEDEIDLSRGEMLADGDAEPPAKSNVFRASLVWMHEQPIIAGQSYLLKHTTRVVRATVRSIMYRVDVVTAEHRSASKLQMNDIAEVEIETNLPLFFDNYEDSRSTGSFILMDPLANATVAAGMISASVDIATPEKPSTANPAFIWLRNDHELLERVLNGFSETHKLAVDIDDPLIPESSLPAVARALQLAQVAALTAREDLKPDTLEAIRDIVGDALIDNEQHLENWLTERP
ncbi:MAG TPA: sulfate adenylyltransferase subunit CysN [Acidobacteriaceae bacterium]|nr:sulfate adenylyltransferase subunit CysN [Acidobacteriaceae bacterium]